MTTPKTIEENKERKLSQVLEQLRRIAMGDSYTDLSGLPLTLRIIAGDIEEFNLENK